MIRRCTTVVAGTCRHPERMVLRGAKIRPLTMPSRVGVIEHAREGVVLFDAGFSPAMSGLAARLYRKIVPYDVAPSTGAAGRLAALGISAATVRHVVISHFHPDHVGGLRDFPNATFHATREAWAAVRGRSGAGALLAGWFPELLPDDFERRVCWIGEMGRGPGGLRAVELLGDDALRAVALPGHAAGQVGLLVRTGARPVLFAADAGWVSENFTELRPPSRITRLIAHDPDEAGRTLARLHALRHELRIVLSHCPRTAELA